jgi:hypothetical protein
MTKRLTESMPVVAFGCSYTTAQQQLHLTAFGVCMLRHFAKFRAIIILSLAMTAGEPNI